jgi:hypothetical protein
MGACTLLIVPCFEMRVFDVKTKGLRARKIVYSTKTGIS